VVSVAGSVSLVAAQLPKPERTTENLDIFDFELTADDIAAINALDRGLEGRVGPNPDPYEGV